MFISSLARKIVGLPNPYPISQYPASFDSDELFASFPYVQEIRQLLVEKNGLNSKELVLSHLTIYYESANDSSVVIGFPLDHTITNGPCNLHFNWSYKDIFIGWSIYHNRYYMTAQGHGVFFAEISMIENSLTTIEESIQQASNDY
jgi:hypothetical protein